MTTPERIVQRQLDAYNARDIDALLATYAPDARQFEHPGKLEVVDGKIQSASVQVSNKRLDAAPPV